MKSSHTVCEKGLPKRMSTFLEIILSIFFGKCMLSDGWGLPAPIRIGTLFLVNVLKLQPDHLQEVTYDGNYYF